MKTKKKLEPSAGMYIRILDEMIESGEFVWAEDTLTGIRETIEEKDEITTNQMQAIFNIRRAMR